MFSFFIGLIVVLFCGGVIVKHAVSPAKKGSKTRATKKGSKPSKVAPALKTAAKATWKYLKERDAKRKAKVLDAHKKAKENGETAATKPDKTIVDRRTIKEAWQDVRDAWRPGTTEPDEQDDVVPSDVVHGPAPIVTTVACPRCGKPHTASLLTENAEQQFVCDCGHRIRVFRQPDLQPEESSKTDKKETSVPTYMTLFEQTDTIAAQPFEHVFQIEHFIRELHAGTGSAGNMYYQLAERMSGPMSVDMIVVEHIQNSGTLQRAVAAAVGDADVNLSAVLSGTVEELLERGIRVPKQELLNGDSGAGAAVIIPTFFETVRTLAGRTFGDVREVHCLIKALREASDAQATLYTHIANKLLDQNVDISIAEQFFLAARHQRGISASLGDADTNMTRLLTMTVRELAGSTIKAPNANLLNV